MLPTGEMVYFIAATVVLYNVEEQMQRHYLGHTDDVKWYEFNSLMGSFIIINIYAYDNFYRKREGV